MRAGLAERDDALVSVVVVATDSAAAVGATVARALATARGSIEVVVVDAHLPPYESTRLLMAAESLPRTRVHRMSFEATLEVARNVGATLARGYVLVFLEEYAWCAPGWDLPLVETLGDHAAVQPVTLDNDGAVWSAGLYFLPDGSPVNLHRGLAGCATEIRGVHAVDAATSACLAVRADRFAEVEGFDPLVMNHLTGGEAVPATLRRHRPRTGLRRAQFRGRARPAGGPRPAAAAEAAWPA